MFVSRRQFLEVLGASSAALAAGNPMEALALPVGAQKVIWLQGSGCTGCSVSFLNRIADVAPQTADAVLLDIVELDFHTTLMTASGDTAVSAAMAVYNAGGYLLVVEGGVPTAFGGAACWAWRQGTAEVTFLSAVRRFAAKAVGIVCIGNCAAYGGVAAAPPNPTGVVGVKAATGRTTINIAGCPAHPDWFVWVVAQLLGGVSITLDSFGRPSALYKKPIHEICPRKEHENENISFGVDGYCLKKLGCRGPKTKAVCPVGKWNGGVNWCIDANTPCIGCTEPNFPVRGLMGYGES